MLRKIAVTVLAAVWVAIVGFARSEPAQAIGLKWFQNDNQGQVQTDQTYPKDQSGQGNAYSQESQSPIDPKDYSYANNQANQTPVQKLKSDGQSQQSSNPDQN